MQVVQFLRIGELELLLLVNNNCFGQTQITRLAARAKRTGPARRPYIRHSSTSIGLCKGPCGIAWVQVVRFLRIGELELLLLVNNNCSRFRITRLATRAKRTGPARRPYIRHSSTSIGLCKGP